MASLRSEISRFASTLPKGDSFRVSLERVLTAAGPDARGRVDKKALLKDGPIGRMLEEHWNSMHDMSREFEETVRDYYDAAHFMGGDAEDDAKAMIKMVEKVAKKLDDILRDDFTDLIEAEGKFVVKFGDPKEYSDNMRRKIFPR